MGEICGKCGQKFNSSKGLAIHESKTEHEKYHNKDYLYNMYVEKRLSAPQIANKHGVDKSYILELLERHDIQRRSLSEAFQQQSLWQPAPLFMGGRGYEFWQDQTNSGADKLYVHRLLAVSEYGIDAVMEKEIHHKNGVKWDNRPGNIELVSKSEHASIHANE